MKTVFPSEPPSGKPEKAPLNDGIALWQEGEGLSGLTSLVVNVKMLMADLCTNRGLTGTRVCCWWNINVQGKSILVMWAFPIHAEIFQFPRAVSTELT